MPSTQCNIGDIVRAKAPGSRAVHGVIVCESHEGKCWLIDHSKGESVYNKVYCTKLSRDEMSRTIKDLTKANARPVAPKWDGESDI